MLLALRVRLQNPDFWCVGAGAPPAQAPPPWLWINEGPGPFTTEASLGLVTPERPEVDPQSPVDGDADPYTPLRGQGAAGEREGEEQGSFSGSPGGEPTCFQLARQHFPDVPLCPLPMAGAEGEGQQDLGDNSWKFCEARGGGGRGSEGLDRAAFWGFRGDHQTALSAGYWLGYWSWGQPPPLSAPGNEK